MKKRTGKNLRLGEFELPTFKTWNQSLTNYTTRAIVLDEFVVGYKESKVIEIPGIPRISITFSSLGKAKVDSFAHKSEVASFFKETKYPNIFGQTPLAPMV